MKLIIRAMESYTRSENKSSRSRISFDESSNPEAVFSPTLSEFRKDVNPQPIFKYALKKNAGMIPIKKITN